MKDYLQTVTGPVAREDMGLTLPHEHLFNDLSSVVDAPCYPFSQRLVDKKVTAEIQWALKHDPYCCADNMDRKPIEDVIFEINNFISLGGRTIVDATGSESIGRDAQALREVALKTGLNIVASSGPYLEKFESQRIHKTVDELAATIDKELNQGIGDTLRVSLTGDPVQEVAAAKKILTFAGLRKFGVEIISCPTCARTCIDLISLAQQAQTALAHIRKPLKIAIMGCAVNGPGEAREADLGIAGGRGEGLLFRKGEIVRKVPEERLLEALVEEANQMCQVWQ